LTPKAPASAAGHVKSFIQIATLPGCDDPFQIAGHETDNLDSSGRKGFLHGPGNGPANERPNIQTKQVLGPVQRLAARQDMLFPLTAPFGQHKDAPADVKDRRDTILPLMQGNARHYGSSFPLAKHEACRRTDAYEKRIIH
jgi:hypothetical protein